MKISIEQIENTLQDFELYLKIEKGVSENTLQAYITDLKQCLDSCKKTGEKEFAIIELVNIYFDSIQSEKELSTFTLARKMASLRSFFRFLVRENLLKEFPEETLVPPKSRRSIPEVLTQEEVIKMLEAIEPEDALSLRNRTILELLYASGLRVSELINLELSNIVFPEQMLRVVGKGNKERWVPFNDIAENFLREYIGAARNELLKNKQSSYVFVNRRGNKLTRQMIFYIVKDAARSAGITKKVSPHSLRHAFATHLLEGGANLQAVSDLLGHAHLVTTEIYLHVSKEHLQNVLQKFHPRYKS